MQWSLSFGSRSIPSTESILIPKKIREVAGPFDLHGSIGRPVFSQIDCIMRTLL